MRLCKEFLFVYFLVFFPKIVTWENVLKAAAVIKKCLAAEIPKPKIVSYLTNKGVNKMEIKAAVELYKERPEEIPTIHELIIIATSPEQAFQVIKRQFGDPGVNLRNLKHYLISKQKVSWVDKFANELEDWFNFMNMKGISFVCHKVYK